MTTICNIQWTSCLEIVHHQEKASMKGEYNAKEEALEKSVPSQYLKDYQSVFEKEAFSKLPPRREWDHAIKLIPDAKPLDCKIYISSKCE